MSERVKRVKRGERARPCRLRVVGSIIGVTTLFACAPAPETACRHAAEITKGEIEASSPKLEGLISPEKLEENVAGCIGRIGGIEDPKRRNEVTRCLTGAADTKGLAACDQLIPKTKGGSKTEKRELDVSDGG